MCIPLLCNHNKKSKHGGGSGACSLGGVQQLTGGGVVADIFRDLQKPGPIQWRGGVVEKLARFSGGGGSSKTKFRDLNSEAGPVQWGGV